MKKLMFLSVFLINCLFADNSEITHESMELLPIAKTVEELARETKKNNQVINEEAIVPNIVKEEITPTNINEKIEDIEVDPYLNALKQAKRKNKIIMLAIRATHCHYCDRMEAETLSEGSVKAELEADFITLYYNQDLEPLPLGLQEGMTPKFVFVNTHEDIINMYPGMRSPEEFKEALAQILAE